MEIMAEAHRRARYERNLQICIAHGIFSPLGVTMSNVAEWRERMVRALGVPASGVDSYAAILANELRYIHHRNRRQRRAA
jgi:hypothetical protein